MWCISAYEYVIGEANMTKIFTVYGYAFKCCRELLRRYGISLLYSFPDVDLVSFFVRSCEGATLLVRAVIVKMY